MRDLICSIGHSNRSIEEFIELLKIHEVECVVDVRTVPKSRRNPQFHQDALPASLARAGIGYRAFPGLGGLRHPRKDSPNAAWRNKSFRGYADYMQTPEFAHSVKDLVALSRTGRCAMMCAEAVPWRCHRSMVADALAVRGVPVEHILGKHQRRPHTLTPFAHVDGTRISYPPEETPAACACHDAQAPDTTANRT